MYILVLGFNHKTAPVAVRERFAFTEKKRSEIYKDFREKYGLSGLVILSTCNRTELYASAAEEGMMPRLYALFAEHFSGELPTEVFYEKTCDDGIMHLYRVAAGLDSMVLGETQILGQLKDAYMEAKAAGAADGVLNPLMQRALAVGKKVRTLTGIDQHPVSVSYIAVEEAKRLMGDLKDKNVLVVGAGEAGALTARYLRDEGVRAVFISNRSIPAAEALAADLKGKAVRFEALPEYLKTVDLVISATGASHLVIHGEACQAALLARKGRPLLFIDIAVPRDVEPDFAEIKGVTLLDMDRLQQVVLKEEAERLKAAAAGEIILTEEMADFRAWSVRRHTVPVIKALEEGKTEALRQAAFLLTDELKAYAEVLWDLPIRSLKALKGAGTEKSAARFKKLFLQTESMDGFPESPAYQQFKAELLEKYPADSPEKSALAEAFLKHLKGAEAPELDALRENL